MAATVQWYQDNAWWWRKIKTGDISTTTRRNYAERLAKARLKCNTG